jgi:hypothetical protein
MQSKDFDLVIYGATGLTGRMIVERFTKLTPRPSLLLAGRDPERLASLAATHGLAWQACQLDDTRRLGQLAARARVLLNAAAPFIKSAAALASVCKAAKTHYTDCSGEFSAVEKVANDSPAGSYATPAVGLVGAGADLLLALIESQKQGEEETDSEVHVCYSAGPSLARGSMASLLANGRMETWVWRTEGPEKGLRKVAPGKYERAFGLPPTDDGTASAPQRSTRIVASAVALPDLTLLVKGRSTRALTTYFEMTPWQRHLLFVQGLNHVPQSVRFLETIANMAPGLMPERLDTGLYGDRKGVQTVVVEWLDRYGRGFRASLGTKDAHAFTAQAMVHVAGMMVKATQPETGYRSPSFWFRDQTGSVNEGTIRIALSNDLHFIRAPERFGWASQQNQQR